jgi:putative flavoprotein involved in K+ transport
MTQPIAVVVVGAGHAGLAMSSSLAARSIDHVVLERGQVAHTWRTERWESLRLLTPNWQSRLPGYSYSGDDPDGFMSMAEVIAFIDGYARHLSAPVHAETTVQSVHAIDDGYLVASDRGAWRCRAVVLATGACNLPNVPAVAAAVPPSITVLTPFEYRNPHELDDGGVLVVGASATGVQLADEIHRSGRPVTLAVGEHVRVPRVYRGMDILWWMNGSGLLDERYDEVDNLVRVRNLPSFQLVGTPDKTTLDLNALTAIGVRLVGKFAGINGGKAQFSGSLRNNCALADLKLGRLLDGIDRWASTTLLDDEFDAPHRFAPTALEESPLIGLDLARGEIRTIIWATGFRPDYSWLDVPVLDRKGRLQHDGGVVAGSPGLYAMGLPFLRRRKSSFIDGAADDARDLSEHLAGHLDSTVGTPRH